jgi:hypothetical protein
MSTESGLVPIVETTTVAVTTPEVAPAASTVTQNETKKGLEVADLVNLTPSQLDDITQAIHDAIPRDAKSGKALLVPEPLVPVDETPVVPTETVPEVAPEPEAIPEPETVPEVVPVVPEVDPEPDSEPGKLVQHRTRATNSFDDMVLRRYKLSQADGRPLTMEQCVNAEKAAQGIVSPKTAPAEVKSIDSAKAELDALWTRQAEAKAAFDPEAEAKLTREIFEKNEEIRDLKEDAKARQTSETHRFQSASENSRLKALSLYPDLAVEGSKIALRKDAIHEAYKANNDPIMYRADYKLLLAQMAAAEEGIAPKTTVVPATAPKPVPARSVPPAKPVVPIVSAAARTTPTSKATNAAAVITGLLGNQSALDELQELISVSIRR